MAKTKGESTTVTFSQIVDTSTKEGFDVIYNDIERRAIDKRVKAPGKGEVLTRIINQGLKHLKIEDFFNK